jgi:hypothetical protein
MRRRELLSWAAGAALVGSTSSCALVLDGAKRPEDRSDQVLWGYLVLDVVLGLVPLIIDLSTGAIFVRLDGRQAETKAYSVATCAEASLALSGLRRARAVGEYLSLHLQTCPTCVAGLGAARQRQLIDLRELMASSPPDVLLEVVKVRARA